MIVSPLLCLLFTSIATLVLVLFSCLLHRGVFGATAFPDFYLTLTLRQRTLMRIWVMSGGLIGLVFPLGVVILWHTNEVIQSMLLPFIGVLLVQIMSERLLVRSFGPLLSPMTGLIYTVFRIVHLILLSVFWQRPITLLVPVIHATVTGVLGTNMLFWSCNLLFLISIALPRVARFHSSLHRT